LGEKAKKKRKREACSKPIRGKGGGGRESERGCSVSRFWKHSRRVAGRARMTPGAMRHGTETRRPCGADGDRVTVAAAERSATPRARKTIGATGNSERRRRETAWETERERERTRDGERRKTAPSLSGACGARAGEKLDRETRWAGKKWPAVHAHVHACVMSACVCARDLLVRACARFL
jgi:hypothetical protein